jgi:hypothetical protein
VRRQDDQREVEVALGEMADEVLRAALLHVQVDAGVGGAKPRQDAGDQAGGEAGRGTEPHPAAAQPDQLLHLAAGGLDVGEDAARDRQQRGTGRGERDRAAGAVEQRGADVALQAVDLLAQRGLGDAEVGRRACEVTLIGDGDEVQELLELHAS